MSITGRSVAPVVCISLPKEGTKQKYSRYPSAKQPETGLTLTSKDEFNAFISAKVVPLATGQLSLEEQAKQTRGLTINELTFILFEAYGISADTRVVKSTLIKEIVKQYYLECVDDNERRLASRAFCSV